MHVLSSIKYLSIYLEVLQSGSNIVSLLLYSNF